MKTTELLTELGNREVDYKTVKSGNITEFIVEEYNLVVSFTSHAGRLIIKFTVNNRVTPTGFGNEVAVMSAVYTILRQELNKFSPTHSEVLFTVDTETSLVKLSRRAIPMITGILGKEWVPSEKETRFDQVLFAWTVQKNYRSE